jgi:hypothetical protein
MEKFKTLDSIVSLLKTIDIDGEGMQYIINCTGMNDQMLRQLIMSNSESNINDVLDEKISLIMEALI